MASKDDFLDTLTDEVKDLHPLLKQLLPKLPDVQHVEYTHGADEMGADFVVQKLDSTTGETRYVGIIAKLGKISQKDADDVEKQLRECKVPRKIAGGSQTIRLNEVWIVCTGGITGNAKDRFSNESAFLSVTFISGERLSVLVDKYASHIWTSARGHLGVYLSGLTERLRILETTSNVLGIAIPRKVLELHVVAIDPTQYGKGKRSPLPVSLGEEIDARRFILIEGSPGAGKSFLIRREAMRLAEAAPGSPEGVAIPVYVSHRDFATRYERSLAKCVSGELKEAATQVMETHRIVVFVDGLDEFASEKSYNETLTEIGQQVAADCRLSVCVTCRTGTIPENRLRTVKDLRHLSVQPLSTSQIATFIRELSAGVRRSKRFLNDINHSDLFKQLPRNPIAAILLGKLVLENLEELPQTLTELYKMSLELMLGRWDVTRNLVTQQEYEIGKRISGAVAEISLKEERDVFTIEEVEQQLKSYMSARHLTPSVERLMERLLSRSGVFAVDEQLGVVRFRHRSFAEFLCAQRIYETGTLEIDARVWSHYWHHTYFFAIGLNPDCEHLLRRTLAIAPTDEDGRWGRLFCTADYLLAAHMSPYSLVETALAESLVEFAVLFDDIVKHRIKTPLASFSELHLLYLLGFLIRRQYGYGYFAKAIDAVALEIDASNHSTDVKSVALLFAGMLGIELDKNEALEFLAKSFRADEVPFVVALAASMEGARMKSQELPARARSFNRQLRGMLKAKSDAERLTFSRYIDRLSKKPIDPKAVIEREAT